MTLPKRISKIAAISAASAALCAAFFAFMPDVSIKPVPENKTAAFAEFSRESAASSEIGARDLNDYAPLFIPTKWNCAPARSPLPKPPSWEFAGNTGEERQSESLAITPGEGAQKVSQESRLLVFMRCAFSGYGSREREISPFDSGRTLVAKNLSTGETALTMRLPSAESDAAAEIAEFVADVAGGRAGMPVLRKSSGDEKYDRQLLFLLRQNLQTLGDGSYKINVIP